MHDCECSLFFTFYTEASQNIEYIHTIKLCKGMQRLITIKNKEANVISRNEVLDLPERK